MSDYSNPQAIRALEALIVLTGDPDLGATKALSILRAFGRDGTTLGSPAEAPASEGQPVWGPLPDEPVGAVIRRGKAQVDAAKSAPKKRGRPRKAKK